MATDELDATLAAIVAEAAREVARSTPTPPAFDPQRLIECPDGKLIAQASNDGGLSLTIFSGFVQAGVFVPADRLRQLRAAIDAATARANPHPANVAPADHALWTLEDWQRAVMAARRGHDVAALERLIDTVPEEMFGAVFPDGWIDGPR